MKKLGPSPPHPRSRDVVSLGWYQEPTKVSYIVRTKVAPSYPPYTALYRVCVPLLAETRKADERESPKVLESCGSFMSVQKF